MANALAGDGELACNRPDDFLEMFNAVPYVAGQKRAS